MAGSQQSRFPCAALSVVDHIKKLGCDAPGRLIIRAPPFSLSLSLSLRRLIRGSIAILFDPDAGETLRACLKKTWES